MSRPNLIPGHSSNIWFNARGAPRVSRDQHPQRRRLLTSGVTGGLTHLFEFNDAGTSKQAHVVSFICALKLLRSRSQSRGIFRVSPGSNYLFHLNRINNIKRPYQNILFIKGQYCRTQRRACGRGPPI